MSFSPSQEKAIAWYMKTHDCIVQMSIKPIIRFKKRSDGSIVEENLTNLEGQFKEHKKTEAAEKRREDHAAKQKEKLSGTYREQYQ